MNSPQAGPEHLDAAYVAAYERKAGYDPRHEIARLCETGSKRDVRSSISGPAPVPSLWLPHRSAGAWWRWTAPMLAALDALVTQHRITNLQCIRAGFLTYVHEGEPADFVCSRHALHHLPDFWKAIALMRVAAMLRPGGVFHLRDLTYSFHPHEADRTIESRLAAASQHPDVGWTRTELEAHVRDEHSTFTWLVEPMLERAGLKIQERELSDSKIYATYICRKPS